MTVKKAMETINTAINVEMVLEAGIGLLGDDLDKVDNDIDARLPKFFLDCAYGKSRHKASA